MRHAVTYGRCAATALALAAVLACGSASAQIVLVVQDEAPLGQPFWTDVLDEAGVAWVTTAGSQLATVPLEGYDLVVVSGFQAAGFNQQVDAAAGRFEDYLATGRDLILVTATDLNEPAITTLPHGATQQHGASFASDEATNLAPTHPVMDGLPATLTGQPVSHGVYESIGHALPLTADGDSRPTSYLAETGAGVALVTSLTFETGGYEPGTDLVAANAVDYLLHGSQPGDDDDSAGDDDDSAGDDDDSAGDDDDSAGGDDDDDAVGDDDDTTGDDDTYSDDDDAASAADDDAADAGMAGCGPSCDGRGGGFTFGFLLPLVGLLGLRRR